MGLEHTQHRRKSTQMQISFQFASIKSWERRGRFNYDNLTGPTTNPDQTLLDPTFGQRKVRQTST
jgi:hypothetical protein